MILFATGLRIPAGFSNKVLRGDRRDGRDVHRGDGLSRLYTSFLCISSLASSFSFINLVFKEENG